MEANWKASKGRKGMPRQGLFGPAKAQEVCHELGYVTTHTILATFISASMPLMHRLREQNRGTEEQRRTASLTPHPPVSKQNMGSSRRCCAACCTSGTPANLASPCVSSSSRWR